MTFIKREWPWPMYQCPLTVDYVFQWHSTRNTSTKLWKIHNVRVSGRSRSISVNLQRKKVLKIIIMDSLSSLHDLGWIASYGRRLLLWLSTLTSLTSLGIEIDPEKMNQLQFLHTIPPVKFVSSNVIFSDWKFPFLVLCQLFCTSVPLLDHWKCLGFAHA